MKRPKSTPIAFWTEQDVLEYLYKYKVPYSPVYGDIIKDNRDTLTLTGCKRTGCMFCMFGVHLEKEPNRFIRMQQTHPQLWNYCINTLGIGNVMDYMGIPYGDRFIAERPLEKQT
jgi:3'-phosphoadenosine 5'-phosphosulfate sulfotransferase (PAPS reductase)/FAD synthetase